MDYALNIQAKLKSYSMSVITENAHKTTIYIFVNSYISHKGTEIDRSQNRIRTFRFYDRCSFVLFIQIGLILKSQNETNDFESLI
jgi:hypothetical protein